MGNMEISVVIPVLNEEENIPILYQKLKDTLDNLDKTYEIIFIDDGSTDRSFSTLKGLYEGDKHVKIIKFRRNFGQSAALKAGFDHAKGDIVVAMDGDLQNDPVDIPKLLEKMDDGYNVVSGWRVDRKDSILKKIPSKFSNGLHKKMTGIQIHDSGCSLKAYKREALEGIELYGEMHRYIPALLHWKGYKVGEVKVTHHKRKHGKTKYGWKRLMKGFLDLLNVSFWQRYYTRPMHLMGGMGIASFAAGFLLGAYLSIQRLFFGMSLANRPILILAVLLIILGIQLIIFGFIAEILIRNYFIHESRMPFSIEKVFE